MQCLVSDSKNPYFNLAVEEILLRKSREEYFILSINDTCVITGKHQCPHMETDTMFVTGNKIPVIRRISGGGAVFHDTGNLNYCFILNCESGKQVDFPKYTKPVMDFLRSAGLDPSLNGSDIRINGQKVSGNAEHVYHNRVLHHGTLLFNASMEMLRGSLRKDTSGYVSRAVASNRSSVINLAGLMDDVKDTGQLMEMMMRYIKNVFPGSAHANLSDNDIAGAEELGERKYKSWEWNYAYGPGYSLERNFDHDGKPIAFQINVSEGIIRECVMTKGPVEIVDALTGCRHMPYEVAEALQKAGLKEIDVYCFF